MATSVICTATVAQTDAILRNLQAAGFSGKDVSVLMADKGEDRDFALWHNTMTPEAATAGAGTGAVVGGTLAWLAGIGMLAIPGLGPFIAAGPIMAALSGAAVGGAVGGVTGALIGMGIPEFEASQYEGKIKAGSSLISIHSEKSDETDRAQEICERAGSKDVTTASKSAVRASIRV